MSVFCNWNSYREAAERDVREGLMSEEEFEERYGEDEDFDADEEYDRLIDLGLA